MAERIQFSDEPTGSEAPAEEGTENTGETGTEGERPEWLPENFNTVEDFVASANEARSELTRAQQRLAELEKGNESETEGNEEEESDEETSENEGDDDEEESEETKTSNADITEEDLAEYSEELAEKGELSDESREAILEKFDIPEFLLDTYIEGVKSINEKMSSSITNAFGGDEQRDAILNWAGQNLSDEDMEAVNKQLGSKDMNSIMFAVDALKGRYESANGRAPARRLNGGRTTEGSSNAFTSWDQVTAAMDDPRYHNNSAYRAEVEEKLRGFKG